MPIYEFECKACGFVFDHICKMNEKPEFMQCPNCPFMGRSIISRPAAIKPDWDEYIDENIGPEPTLVRGRGHRRELMKREGLEEVDMSPQRKEEVMQKLRHAKREGSLKDIRQVKRRKHG